MRVNRVARKLSECNKGIEDRVIAAVRPTPNRIFKFSPIGENKELLFPMVATKRGLSVAESSYLLKESKWLRNVVCLQLLLKGKMGN